MIRILSGLFLLLAAPLLPSGGAGAQPREMWSGADYDPAIPAPEEVIGHALGERLTNSGDVRR